MATGSQHRRPIYQRWWFLVGAIVLLAILGRGLFGGTNTRTAAPLLDPSAASSTSASPSTTPPSPMTPSPESTKKSADQSPRPEPTEQAQPPKAETKPEPALEFGKQPAAQRQFVAVVTEARDTAAASDNDLKRGAALAKRNKAICRIVSGGRVDGWTGRVAEIDANNDGYGILSIEIGEDIHISTWNNAFSDLFDNTLIKPGRLFDDVAQLEPGSVIEFSGRLIKDSEGCVNDRRLTLTGKIDDPDFVFRFADVS